MDFFIDECVLGKTRKFLKELGFSTLSVVDLDKTSSSDNEVLNLAKQQEAILVTNDLHFSNIFLYPPASHSGIIVLRLRASETPGEIKKVHHILDCLLKELNLSAIKGKLTIVDRNKYRIHK